MRISLGPGAQRRLSFVLADIFGESLEVVQPVAAFLDDYLRRVPLQAAFGLRAMCWAVTWLPLLFIGVPLPAHALSAAARQRYLLSWTSSRFYFVREGFYLLKAIALMGWGAQPVVRARMGLPPMAAPRLAPPELA